MTPQTARNPKGCFTEGNPGGPGNPFGPRMAANREAILDAIGPQQITALMFSLYDRGMAGHVGAARLVLLYTVGKPQPPEIDPVDVDASPIPQRQAAAPTGTSAQTAPVEAPEKATTTAKPPFVPSSDGADPKVRKESRRKMDEVVDAIREGSLRGRSPFAPLLDGSVAHLAVANPDATTVCPVP